jgi:signal peptidase I
MSRIVVPAAVFFVAIAAGCGGSNRGRSTTTIVLNRTPTPRIYRVPSASMEPTYGVGSVVVAQIAEGYKALVIDHSSSIFHLPDSGDRLNASPKHRS